MNQQELLTRRTRDAELELARLIRELDALRAVTRARRIAGILTDEDLQALMKLDAAVERAVFETGRRVR